MTSTKEYKDGSKSLADWIRIFNDALARDSEEAYHLISPDQTTQRCSREILSADRFWKYAYEAVPPQALFDPGLCEEVDYFSIFGSRPFYFPFVPSFTTDGNTNIAQLVLSIIFGFLLLLAGISSSFPESRFFIPAICGTINIMVFLAFAQLLCVILNKSLNACIIKELNRRIATIGVPLPHHFHPDGFEAVEASVKQDIAQCFFVSLRRAVACPREQKESNSSEKTQYPEYYRLLDLENCREILNKCSESTIFKFSIAPWIWAPSLNFPSLKFNSAAMSICVSRIWRTVSYLLLTFFLGSPYLWCLTSDQTYQLNWCSLHVCLEILSFGFILLVDFGKTLRYVDSMTHQYILWCALHMLHSIQYPPELYKSSVAEHRFQRLQDQGKFQLSTFYNFFLRGLYDRFDGLPSRSNGSVVSHLEATAREIKVKNSKSKVWAYQ